MKYKYPCDIIKFLLACICIPIFTGLVCGCIYNAVYPGAIIFAALDVLYICCAVKKIAMVYVDDQGVERRVLGRTTLSFRWNELKEVGTINKRYVYFSTEKMDDDGRNEMCFQWPPKDKIYFLADRKARETIERLWSKRDEHFVSYKPDKIKIR